MTKKDFFDLISSKTVILDGATGTQLQKNGLKSGQNPEEWILNNPEMIKKIQSEYVNAGSDIIYAPTFGATSVKLKGTSLADVAEANKKLVALSKEVCQNSLVAGDISPLGLLISMSSTFEECVDIYKEQIQALVNAGVDLLIIETMLDVAEARAAVIAAKEICDLPIMCTLTFDENQRCVGGTDVLGAMLIMQDAGVDAFGANCGTGPSDMIKVIEKIAKYAKVPIIAKPNAGLPQTQPDGSVIFNMGTKEFADYAVKLVEAGVSIIGGCCGSTPECIKAMKDAIADKKASINKEHIKALASPTAICIIDGNTKTSDEVDLSSDAVVDRLFEVGEDCDVIKLVCNDNNCDIENIIAEISMYATKPFSFEVANQEVANRIKRAYNGKGFF